MYSLFLHLIKHNCSYKVWIFRRIRKISKNGSFSFVRSVRLSVRYNPAPTGRIFMKFDIWVFLKNLSRKISFIKIGQEQGVHAWRPMYITIHISLNSYYNEKCFRQQLYIKSKHTFYVENLAFENRTVHDIMWKQKCLELGRPQMTVRRLRITCWIPEATNTHLLLVHRNNGRTNAPQCYVIVHCLSCFSCQNDHDGSHYPFLSLYYAVYVIMRSWGFFFDFVICAGFKSPWRWWQ